MFTPVLHLLDNEEFVILMIEDYIEVRPTLPNLSFHLKQLGRLGYKSP
jgi:hypothetical protein